MSNIAQASASGDSVKDWIGTSLIIDSRPIEDERPDPHVAWRQPNVRLFLHHPTTYGFHPTGAKRLSFEIPVEIEQV